MRNLTLRSALGFPQRLLVAVCPPIVHVTVLDLLDLIEIKHHNIVTITVTVIIDDGVETEETGETVEMIEMIAPTVMIAMIDIIVTDLTLATIISTIDEIIETVVEIWVTIVHMEALIRITT